MKKKIQKTKVKEGKGIFSNKKVLLGIFAGLLVVIVIAALFSGVLTKPAGQLYKPETGIKNFLKTNVDTIYIDSSLSSQTESKVRELAAKYEIKNIKVLESDTKLSNSIIVSKKENPNLLVVEQNVGSTATNEESLMKLNEDSRLLYVIGDESSLEYTSDILKDASCELLAKDSIIVKTGAGCEGIRQHVLCDIG
ncbi:MAG: hypothetical protein HY831_04625 [Candidatus Aenigmarchaeota archaeon]|nr:hypothetical protein [Candidatus Aenigmarchaeota archaeon]